MRNLLALLAAAVLAFAGVGWYLGWYQVNSQPSLSGHQKVDIDINSTKIIADVKKGRQVVEDMKKSAQEASSSASDASAPAPTSPAPVVPAVPSAVAPR
jgi:hypothetical protein